MHETGLAGRAPSRSASDRWTTRPAPVVSVGNIAMGGRGKTPVVAMVAQILVAAGERPAILSRGYKRRRPEPGAVIVSDGVHMRADLDRAGDEPIMLARAAPGAAVLVCDVRAIAAALAERALGATVHVLDDGFQHRSLRRDIDIVIVTPGDLDGRRAPFGALRSSPKSLAAAEAVIIDSPDPEEAADRLGRLLRPGQTTIFGMRRALGAPRPMEPAPGALRPLARGATVVAVAGIAHPERFENALAAAGWPVAASVMFADHHPYRARDVARIAAAVRASGAEAVLTTEKDAVRLLPLRPLPFPVFAVPLEIELGPHGRFGPWLLDRVQQARKTRA